MFQSQFMRNLTYGVMSKNILPTQKIVKIGALFGKGSIKQDVPTLGILKVLYQTNLLFAIFFYSGYTLEISKQKPYITDIQSCMHFENLSLKKFANINPLLYIDP